LDFDVTNTTRLSVNLGGYYGAQQDNYNHGYSRIWNAFYRLAPDLMQVVHDDGVWGYSIVDEVNLINPVAAASETGIRKRKRTELNSNFVLQQNLDFLLKGLSFRGTFAYDNFIFTEGGLTEGTVSVTQGGNTLMKYVDPAIEDAEPGEDINKYIFYIPSKGVNQFEFIPSPWRLVPESVESQDILRRKNYQTMLNYARTFGKHSMTAMGLFSREEYAKGNMFPTYREDWVFRTTYDFNTKYFLELNSAYNGSEQFGPGYRFGFFPSVAMGWMLSEESFLDYDWLDIFKVRFSHGLIGDDKIVGGRWAYISEWAYGNRAQIGQYTRETSPYVYYREKTIGNPTLHWEVAEKTDLGIEASILNGLFSANVDFFRERRSDIIMPGGAQSVPDFFGGTPPAANLGEVYVKGYELELGTRFRTGNGILFKINGNVGRAIDKVIYRDDPPLLDDYRKQQGFQIGQTRSQVSSGYYNNWDEVFASVELETNDKDKLPGHFNLLDFNGDGIINSFDNVPVAYPMRPQNTYSLTLRTDYKAFRFHVQLYGVTNVSRNYAFPNFLNYTNLVFDQGDYWSKDNLNASSFVPRWKTSAQSTGDYYVLDASYLRLKTTELSYTFKMKSIGNPDIRLYIAGNNLLFWSKLPDDRESHENQGEGDAGNSTGAGIGTYPTMKRINFGLELTF
jgi:TonB-linked SusC/RagA family outer membrane protein